MALVDQLLAVMVKKGALEFTMRPGQKPLLKMADGTNHSFSRVLTSREVLHLTNEVLPASDRIDEQRIRELTFPYALEGGEKVVFSVRRDKDSFCVICHSDSFIDLAYSVPRLPEEEVAEPPAEEPQPAEELVATLAVPLPETLTMDYLFRAMKDQRASDLHLSCGNPPMMRVDGDVARLEAFPELSEPELSALLMSVLSPKSEKEFLETGDADFAYELRGVGRFRANCFRDRIGPGAAFRLIPEKIVTVEDLGLSEKVQGLCFLKKGLVLVTGPTGSGKSTTLSSMLDLVNRKRRDHVITIEEPIEFVHENKGCLINQREVGVHTRSFKHALRAALREDPDVVLVGEMRDLETVAIAIETAVTGHLVFATLHTSSAASTIDRIIDQFPPEQQSQVRVMLGESLKGVVSQVLLKKKGGGRVAAMEVMIGTPSISNLIREGKTFQIPSIMQTSRNVGMVTMNDALLELVKEGTVEVGEAYRNAVDKDGFVSYLKRNNIEVDIAGLSS